VDDDRVAGDVEHFYDTLYEILAEKHANPLADFQADYQGFLVDFSSDCYMLANDLGFTQSYQMCSDLIRLLETTFQGMDVFSEGTDEDFLDQVDEAVEEYRQEYLGFADYQGGEYMADEEGSGDYMGETSHQTYLAHDRVVLELDLKMNFELVAGEVADLHLFVKAFISATAKTLNIPDVRVSVLDVDPGSPSGVHVKFAINADANDDNAHSNPSDPSSVDALSDKFVSMAKDTTSELYNSAFLSRVDLNKEITVTKQTATTDESEPEERSSDDVRALAHSSANKHSSARHSAATTEESAGSSGDEHSAASIASPVFALLLAFLCLL